MILRRELLKSRCVGVSRSPWAKVISPPRERRVSCPTAPLDDTTPSDAHHEISNNSVLRSRCVPYLHQLCFPHRLRNEGTHSLNQYGNATAALELRVGYRPQSRDACARYWRDGEPHSYSSRASSGSKTGGRRANLEVQFQSVDARNRQAIWMAGRVRSIQCQPIATIKG